MQCHEARRNDAHAMQLGYSPVAEPLRQPHRLPLQRAATRPAGFSPAAPRPPRTRRREADMDTSP
jgi:hypothetical protein